MKDEYLPFKRCLDRLEHNFLKITYGYYGDSDIDFQHPSLRDMLLAFLQNEPKVRMKYISLASSQGLADVIRGIPLYGSTATPKTHCLILQNKTEVDLLCKRIQQIMSASSRSRDKTILLNSVATLIPSPWKKKKLVSETQIKKFHASSAKKVVDAVVSPIAENKIYDNNHSYSLHQWLLILYIFYDLAPFISPTTSPPYLSKLVLNIDENDIFNGLKLIELLLENDPIVVKQILTQELSQYWIDYLGTKLEECLSEGEEFEQIPSSDQSDYNDKQSQYDGWRYDAEQYIKLTKYFYDLIYIEVPDELEALEDFILNSEGPLRPDEVEDDDDVDDHDNYYSDTSTKEYWTIERLFEDL